MEYLIGVLIAVVVLLASIALHEVGHMVPAKRFGVRVSHYFVGFGPTLWSRTRGETEYGVKAIPLGGFVRLVGMYAPAEAVGNPPARTWLGRLAQDARAASAEEIRPGEDHRAFYRLSTPKKLVVMLGGPVMNLIIAFVLMAVVMLGFGVPTTTATLGTVSQCVIPADEPADRTCTATDEPAPGAAAGLLPGDTVIRYDGVAVASWDQLTGLIRASGGQATPVVVQRDGQEVELTVTPVLAQRPVLDDDGEPVLDDDGRAIARAVGFLGVTPTTAMVPTGVGEVPQVVAERTWQTMSVVATLPARMVDLVETTFGQEERGTDSIVGIVGVGRFAGEIASYDADGIDWGDKLAGLLEMLAALNLALFVFNLIPLPPLDGGHVAAALWEGAKRQVARVRGLPRPGPFDTARLVPLAYGVFVVLGLMGVLLIYADIVNPVRI
ncbi:M50 family metallopeptidase [Cellulomonas gilvus]|uniref:Peptidase M50 n=1 Tax=Cellulomonas gilvus (strain ATCC 13127 / NRRL B-14078) TaxID=593907 RepID=F7ZZU6_CELGA|nr:site-2 protease family protein [Cellulomonas gilvus]AEI12589.1 peptidase M50 [Cellulomonas gilvus ATCC 13127]